MCVLGYCLFPLTIAALINVFVHTFFIRLPVIAVTYTWSAIGSYLRPKVLLILLSFGVGITWKPTWGPKMACHLPLVVVLFRIGVYHSYFKLKATITFMDLDPYDTRYAMHRALFRVNDLRSSS